MGEIVAVITALVWALGIFPFTEASIRLGPLAVNNFRLLLAVVFLTTYLLTFEGLSIPQLFVAPSNQNFIYLSISGVVGLALGDYFSFASFAILGARMGSIFSTLSPAFVFIIAATFIDEKLSIIGALGMCITLVGVLIVLLSKHEKNNFRESEFGSFRKGLIFGVLSALCQSIGVVLTKYGLQNNNIGSISAAHASWIRMVGATAIAYIAVIILGKLREINRPIFTNKNNGLIHVFLGTLCGPVVGMICSMYVLANVQASVAQTIFSLVPVFVLFLNYLFYKEKITMRSALGASIAIAGVYILMNRNSIAVFLGVF